MTTPTLQEEIRRLKDQLIRQWEFLKALEAKLPKDETDQTRYVVIVDNPDKPLYDVTEPTDDRDE